MEQMSYANNQINLDAVFSALADPTRREILSQLSKGEASVNELAAPFSISQPAISKHLKVLEQAVVPHSSPRLLQHIEPHRFHRHDFLST